MSQNEIIERIRSDGKRELGLIYERYRSEFLTWTGKSFHCSIEDSKDIYHYTILIFYDKVKSGKLQHLDSSVKTYLFGIGKNVAREHLRRTGRTSRLQHDQGFWDLLAGAGDDPMDESLFEAASRAMNRLNDSERRMIELFYYGDKSMDQISVLLHYKNADSAKNQKCKVMAHLRKLFGDEVRRVAQLDDGGWMR
ncbi:MAG TPA: sigma-70 family RNA polymerase sigma factor [Chryseosolibacter sp.]|nr:sigma-70 family RNA polymerase sigma factor [Chryseosolibacter sp.]